MRLNLVMHLYYSHTTSKAIILNNATDIISSIITLHYVIFETSISCPKRYMECFYWLKNTIRSEKCSFTLSESKVNRLLCNTNRMEKIMDSKCKKIFGKKVLVKSRFHFQTMYIKFSGNGQ